MECRTSSLRIFEKFERCASPGRSSTTHRRLVAAHSAYPTGSMTPATANSFTVSALGLNNQGGPTTSNAGWTPSSFDRVDHPLFAAADNATALILTLAPAASGSGAIGNGDAPGGYIGDGGVAGGTTGDGTPGDAENA
jgi:hypothetical protein